MDELDHWKTTGNPIVRLRQYMENQGWWDEQQDQDWKAEARKEVCSIKKGSLQYCRILPCIYIVICLNISHFVGALLHLFTNSILFAHSFPTVSPLFPPWAHTSPPSAHMLAPPTSLSLVHPQVRWFYLPFSWVPTVGTSWAHNWINTDAEPFSKESYLDSPTENIKPVLEPTANCNRTFTVY